jgi:tetratricopeptide (TPR) repeat protein
MQATREKSPPMPIAALTPPWIALCCLLALSSPPTPRAQASAPPSNQSSAEAAGFTPDAQLLPAARRGMFELLNGDPDGALRIFEQMRREHPDSPLGYLLGADATWWRIYLTTGNLIDPDVFDVVSKDTSPHDASFQTLVQEAIRRADARVRAKQDLARSLLDEGMAYGLLARFYGLRDNDLPTARAGKKMRALLLRALQLDPGLTDAYLGVGIYNYFVDTLPTIVKMLKFLIGLPGGSREVGLQQLELAANKADIVRGEAQFYLAKDFSRGNERQYGRSLQLFRQLASEYPGNPLWTLVEGSLEIRLGHRQAGRELYRKAVERSAAQNTDVGRALHTQAQQALSRLGS